MNQVRYSILDFGASTEQTYKVNGRAIQAAIEQAHRSGGGVVEVPAGVFNTTNVKLLSNVTLELAPGSVLNGSLDYHDYTLSGASYSLVEMMGIPAAGTEAYWCALVYAEQAENISICGSGTLEMNGQGHDYFPHPEDPCARRPMGFFFDQCTNVRISGITFRDPAEYAILGHRSDTILLENLRVFSWESENGDGLDFNGCSNILIRACIVEAGDDAISLKTTYPDWPCRNVIISDCILRSVWAGFRMGTESTADMKDILISNCMFERCNDGLKIQCCSTGVYENVLIRNVSMRDVHRPIFMTTNSFRLARADHSVRPRMGGIRNVQIDGMTAYMSKDSGEYQRNCCIISGVPKCAIEEVSLRNIRMVFDGPMEPGAFERVDVPEYLDYSFLYADIFSINGGFPAAGLFLRHVKDLTMENCRLIREDDDPRPMVVGYDLEDVSLRSVRVSGSPAFFQAENSQIRLEDCTFEGQPAAVEPFPAHLQQRFADFRKVTAETDALFDRLAATVDQAEACAVEKPVEGWEKTEDRWTTELELTEGSKWLKLVSYGAVEVRINGTLAGSVRLHEMYDNICAWAVDLRRFGAGRAVVELRWLEPGKSGGIDCVLPFGRFAPFAPGLCGTAKLCED